MPLTESDLRTLDAATGGSAVDASASGEGSPNGRNLLGAVNEIKQILNDCNEYGMAVADLPQEKQDRLQSAHDDLQYWLCKLSNVLATDFVGSDGSYTHESGTTYDLPNAATSGSTSADIPSDPDASN